MFTAAIRNPIRASKFVTKAGQSRCFWEYVNMMFNKPDPERINLVGPDRACAEWVLRNGGSVVWSSGVKLSDYNLLPPDDTEVPKLTAIDATKSSISHYGFSHLVGCTMLYKIILHDCSYIDDRALRGLSFGAESLTTLQVSKIPDVHDAGVKEIKELHNLKSLALFDLPSVNDLTDCKQYLGIHLPKCKIQATEVEQQ